jgi:hypothetical protein
MKFQQVYCNFTWVSSLDKATFAGMVNWHVNWIFLHVKQLLASTLGSNAFRGLRNLFRMELSRLGIVEVKPGAFAGLENFEKIVIDREVRFSTAFNKYLAA